MEGHIRYRWKQFYVLSFFFIIPMAVLCLSGCRLGSDDPKVVESLVVSWTSYEEDDGSIILSWTSSGGKDGHRYILQRLTAESDWLPEEDVLYSDGDSSIPGLLYAGTDITYTDSTVIAGKSYYYRLFVVDGKLNYADPVTVTISIPAADTNDDTDTDSETDTDDTGGISTVEAPRLLSISQKSYYTSLSWEGSGTDTAGYIIARSESDITWVPVNGASYSSGDTLTDATVVYNGTDSSYNDTDVIDGHEYHYKIFAYNSDNLYSYGLSVQLLFEDESDLLFDRFPWVDNYIIYYGALDSQAISTLKEYDMAIIHPTNNHITRDQVRQVQRGKNSADPSDDVLVIAYVAVGEDLRTAPFFQGAGNPPNYTAMQADERFVRNGIGPRVDPRGPKPNGDTLEYNYSIGSISPGGSGFASYYLDDNDVVNNFLDGSHVIDGKPDFNDSWGCAFVNAGDPLWFQEVDQMRYASDGVFGLQELLTTTVGEGLGVDGIFMDAMDTFEPNSWTSLAEKEAGTCVVQCEFEWTAPGFADFIRRLKEKYPDKIVVQNRAVYLFRSGFTQKYLYYTSRPYIDFLMFESFRLDSAPNDLGYDSNIYPDNRYNYAPAILAEAARDDGFQVLSLGYAEDKNGNLKSDLDAGIYNSSLEEDIKVTQNIGFRHYLTLNGAVTHLNTYVLDYGDWSDTAAPKWSSVYNAHSPGEATPRYGLLKAEGVGGGKIKVYWDVALDKYPVDYYLYYDTAELDFTGNPELNGIRHVKLSPRIPEEYQTHTGALDNSFYPFYDVVDGFTPGTTYYLCIRAVDRSPNQNMDTNTSTLFLTVF